MKAKAHAVLLLLLLGAGCLGAAPETVAGRYSYINWGNSQKSCNNDVCEYGRNDETFEAPVRCHEEVELSWDLENWIHGSMTVLVFDGAGEKKHQRTLANDGNGHALLNGTRGEWMLQGNTNDANGNLQVRLTCE